MKKLLQTPKMITGLLSIGILVSITGCSSSQPTSIASQKPSQKVAVQADESKPDPSTSELSNKKNPTPIDLTKAYPSTSVAFLNEKDGWIGGRGFILHTSDRGKQWFEQYKGPFEIESIHFLDAAHGWALGRHMDDTGALDSNVVLQTTDGGLYWNMITDLKSGSILHFTSNRQGFYGNHLTTDGGISWKSLPIPDEYPLQTVSSYFNDTQTGWSLVQDKKTFKIEHTTDGGKHWNSVFQRSTTFPISNGQIQSTSPNDAWVMVYGDTGMTQTSYTLLHTSDAGAHWTPVILQATAGGGPAPGYSEQESANKGGPGTKPGDWIAIDSNNLILAGVCPACGEQGAVGIGYTTDGGKNYINTKNQFPGQESSLSFLNSNQGFLLTTNPSILYSTKDSGKTWTKVFQFDKNKN